MDIAIALAVIVASGVVASMTMLPGGIATVWISGGLLVAIFVSIPPRRWWTSFILLAGSFYALFVNVGWTPSAALVRTLSEVLTAVAVAVAIRRLSCLPLRTSMQVAQLAGVALAAGIVRFAAVEYACRLDSAAGAGFGDFTLNVLVTAFVGVLVVVPFGVALSVPPAWQWPERHEAQRVLAAVAVALILLLLLQVEPFAPWWTGVEFLAFPVMIWAALTLQRRALAILLMAVTVVVSWTAVRGVGPFSRVDSDSLGLQSDSLRAQSFLAVLALTVWSIYVIRESWSRTLAQLQESSSRLHAAVDRAAVPMGFGPLLGGPAEANGAMASFLEVPEEQLATTDWRRVTHPDDLAEDLRLTAAMARGEIDHFRLLKRYVLHNGSIKWGQLNMVRLDDVDADVPWGLAQIVDMTAEMRSREELERSQQRFRTVVHKTSIPMSFGPMDNALAEVNDARCAFHERTREELVRMDWRDLIHREDLEAMQPLHEALVSGKTDRYQVLQRCLMPDGRIKWGDVTAARLDLDDEVDDFVVVQIVDVTPEVDARERLQHLVNTEQVTGLGSRLWITGVLETSLTEAAGAGTSVAALFVDLSEYERVLNGLGYEAGEELLAALAHAVAGAVPDDCLVGRFWGDRLLIVAPNVTDTTSVGKVTQGILEAVSAVFVVQGSRISRTGSIGVAVSGRASTSTSMLRAADRALILAKQSGRSRWHLVHDVDPLHSDTDHLRLEHDLREALDRHQFILLYQPQVRLDDGVVCGFEALVRWQHPERGLLSPETFLDLMEASGLVVPLGRQILSMACAHIATTPDLPGPISVNVSAIELMEADWFTFFADTVKRFGIPADRLIVELTETTVLQMTTDARLAMAGIREMGAGLHMDDFGTGYASIGVLQQVPLTGLKLDRSFVTPLMQPTQADIDLVQSIATMAKGLHLEAIAEGIETPGQAALLRDAGWAIGQGYLYGKPVAGVS